MGLISAVSDVFEFLSSFWYFLPVAVRLLVTSSFLSVAFICVLNGVRD